MKKITAIIAAGSLMLGLSLNINAQNALHKHYYSIEKLERETSWLTSANAAGLVFNKADNFSTIGAYYNGESGDLRGYNTPKTYNVYGIETKSYIKQNKVFFFGKFGYEYGVRQDQKWLGTIYPGSNINVITDSIGAKVLRENYTLGAKIGYQLNNKLAIGIGFDYLTSTAAKRKDGRNSNTMSNHSFTPGIIYSFGDFRLGLNALYTHRAEEVSYSYLGDVTGKYLVYFNGGLWMYTKNGLTTTTITDRSYYQDIFGGGLQFEFDNGEFGFHNDLKVGYLKENNYEGSNKTKRYAILDGLSYDYKGVVSAKGETFNHFVNLTFKSEELFSYDVVNNYEQVPGEGNSWAYFEYGKVMRYSQVEKQFGFEYQGYLKRCDFDYSAVFTAGVKGSLVEKRFKIYPAKYDQDYQRYEFYAQAAKSFCLGNKDRIEFSAGVAQVTADGTMLRTFHALTDGVLSMNTSLLKQDFLFNTLGQFKWNAGVKYQNAIGKSGKSFTAAAKYTNVKAIDEADIQLPSSLYNGKTRNYFQVSVSYNF